MRSVRGPARGKAETGRPKNHLGVVRIVGCRARAGASIYPCLTDPAAQRLWVRPELVTDPTERSLPRGWAVLEKVQDHPRCLFTEFVGVLA